MPWLYVFGRDVIASIYHPWGRLHCRGQPPETPEAIPVHLVSDEKHSYYSSNAYSHYSRRMYRVDVVNERDTPAFGESMTAFEPKPLSELQLYQPETVTALQMAGSIPSGHEPCFCITPRAVASYIQSWTFSSCRRTKARQN